MGVRYLQFTGWLVGAVLLCQSALAISYTVQVAALSDEDGALALQQSLRQEGYPAYLVSVPDESGTIFRLRVGAFADRAAAQMYAQTMRGAGGTTPIPALAEGIPAELFPLEPALLSRYSAARETTELTVVPWGEGAALRTQGHFEDQPFVAEYRVLRESVDAVPFEAWRAQPQGEAILRVYNRSLWPEEASPSEGEREAYSDAQLGEVARSLELTPEQVRAFLFLEPGRGAPYLVLAERFDAADLANAEVTGGSGTGGSSSERYRALGNPAQRLAPAGPSLTWFDRAPPRGFPTDLNEPLFNLQTRFVNGELQKEDSNTLSGDGWTASPQGDYTQISVGDRTWRAVVGYPLWAGGDYLLVYADMPMLYKLVRPQ